jgi:protein-S-isoprenylcysteine O-methyltransferase Ste14
MRSALRLAFIVIGSCAYAGLAVLGWGGFRLFFYHAALTTLVVVLFALSILSFFAGGNLSPGVREARSNRWVIAVFVIIGFLNAYLPAYTDRMDLLTIDGDTIRWFGVVFFALGGVLRIWPVFVLGHRFSGLVAIQSGHTLVTNGVYTFIRHPSYLGLLINSLGWSLAFRSGVGVLLTVFLIPPLVARIDAEENLLHSEFGDNYNAYRSRTWRLIPGIY